MTRLQLLAAALCAAGCAPRAPSWGPAEATFTAPNAGFAVVLPAGWARFDLPEHPDDLLLSHDGEALNQIFVSSYEPAQPFYIGGSKRAVTAAMSPREAAEAVIDGLESASGMSELSVVENAPLELAGRKGFRIIATFRSGNGLKKGIAVAGLVTPSGIFYLQYTAPERVYFARSLPAFDGLAASLRLRRDAKGVHRARQPEPPAASPAAAPERPPAGGGPAPAGATPSA